MHGEHPLCGFVSCALRGLSPYARGTLWSLPESVRLERFIPVCTGNTSRNPRGLPASPVYPRMHGEHLSVTKLPGEKCGLSPYARGTLANDNRVRTGPRFIPVCTGNTSVGSTGTSFQPVYPRMHGEHGLGIEYTPDQGGLSPYARGTR